MEVRRFLIFFSFALFHFQRPRLPSALVRLRGTQNVHYEMDVMKNEAEAAEFVPKVTLPEMMRNEALRAPLIISLMVMLAQQLSGINAVRTCANLF